MGVGEGGAAGWTRIVGLLHKTSGSKVVEPAVGKGSLPAELYNHLLLLVYGLQASQRGRRGGLWGQQCRRSCATWAQRQRSSGRPQAAKAAPTAMGSMSCGRGQRTWVSVPLFVRKALV